MTALEQTIAEIKAFNGETFTAKDINNIACLNYLVAICRVKILPKVGRNHKKIYQQVTPNDPVIKVRRMERLAYWAKSTSSTLAKLQG